MQAPRSELLLGLANRLIYESQTEKLVMMSYCDHADQDGRAWPSLSLVAAEAMVSVRTVQRTIKTLAERGLLVLVRDGRGRRRSAIYEVRPHAAGPILSYQELKERGRKIPESGASEPVDKSEKTRHKGDAFSAEKTTSRAENTTPDASKTRHPGGVLTPREPISEKTRARDARAVDNSDPPANSPNDIGWASGGARPRRGRPPPARESAKDIPAVDELERRAEKAGIEGQQRGESDYQLWRRVLDGESQLKVMNSTARQLGEPEKRSGETLAAFNHRIAEAHWRARGLQVESDPAKAREALMATAGRRTKE